MTRGELWTVTGGTYASKPRPALVIQDDAFDANDSLTVIPCTTELVSSPLTRVRVPADVRTGLDRDSHLMIDKITTVKRTGLGIRVGELSSDQLVEVERAVAVFLGLAR